MTLGLDCSVMLRSIPKAVRKPGSPDSPGCRPLLLSNVAGELEPSVFLNRTLLWFTAKTPRLRYDRFERIRLGS